MKAKEPAFAYGSQNTMSSLRHQLITQIENSKDASGILEITVAVDVVADVACVLDGVEVGA